MTIHRSSGTDGQVVIDAVAVAAPKATVVSVGEASGHTPATQALVANHLVAKRPIEVALFREVIIGIAHRTKLVRNAKFGGGQFAGNSLNDDGHVQIAQLYKVIELRQRLGGKVVPERVPVLWWKFLEQRLHQRVFRFGIKRVLDN